MKMEDRAYIKPRKFPRQIYCDNRAAKGPYLGNELLLYPTNLTHPTLAVLHKVLRYMTGVGYVECVGLIGVSGIV